MAKVTVAAESSRIASEPFLTEERLINCYPVVAPDGAVGKLLFRSCLGYGEAFASLGSLVVRNMAAINGKLYAVGAGTLWEVTTAGAVVDLAEVKDSPLTTISGNGTAVTLAAGGTYYTWDSALSTPTPGRIVNVGSVGYLGGYTLLSERDGNEIEWTTLQDPTTRNGLHFLSAETVNDKVLRVVDVGPNGCAIGEQSVEIIAPTTQSGAEAFVNVAGGVIKRGCLGALLNVVFDPGDGSGDNLWWIGDDKVPYRANSVSPQPLPRSAAVVAAIEAETPTHCFFYEDQGHKFFCIRFANRPAWCYDARMGFWHERSTGVAQGGWEVIATARVGTTWYAATTTGTIYRLARVNRDGAQAMRRAIVFRPIEFAGAQFSIPELEVLAHSGGADIGRDATVSLRMRRDGRPWSEEIRRSLGSLGEYGTRAVWRALGTQRHAVYEVSISDPADLSVASDANMQAA